MSRLLFTWLVFAACVYGCQRIDGDRIRGADLAAAASAFSSLDPSLEIGLSPIPGVKRVLHGADLLRLARSHGIELSTAPAEVCFERSATAVQLAATPARIAPLAVHRGDKVAVTVSSGSVLLRFESEAESSGRPGDTVIVLNPENGNRFVARVDGQGKVTVKK